MPYTAIPKDGAAVTRSVLSATGRHHRQRVVHGSTTGLPVHNIDVI